VIPQKDRKIALGAGNTPHFREGKTIFKLKIELEIAKERSTSCNFRIPN